jgi:hypothetical protein
LTDDEFEKDRAKQWFDDPNNYIVFGQCPFHWIIKLTASSHEMPVYVIYDNPILIASNFSDFLLKWRTSDAKSIVPYSDVFSIEN